MKIKIKEIMEIKIKEIMEIKIMEIKIIKIKIMKIKIHNGNNNKQIYIIIYYNQMNYKKNNKQFNNKIK